MKKELPGNSFKELPTKIFDLLHQRYNVLDHISFLEFDFEFDILRSRLSKCTKDSFDNKDRIIVEHMDTDYYFDECCVGVNLRNFFGIVRELDISPSVFIFYTNHFGISKEIDQLCTNKNDRPTVIESFLSKLHYSQEHTHPIALNADQIQYHALCMMVLKRSHRNAMYNAIKDIDQSKLMLSITGDINNHV
jgi:hypothetical protein